MKVIGITGGIGSGKSYVCAVLEKMGYPIYYSDVRAKMLMNKNTEIKGALIQLLGPQTYVDNELNTAYLSSKIFNDNSLRDKVNKIVHPSVRVDFEAWKDTHQDAELIFNEAAILFETGAHVLYDAIILVFAPIEVRINRLQKRDGQSRKIIEEKIDAQWKDAKKKNLTPYHICNDGKQPIQHQIDLVIERINKPF